MAGTRKSTDEQSTDETEALKAQALLNDPSAGDRPADATTTLANADDLAKAAEVGYIGQSPARALADGAEDKGLSQRNSDVMTPPSTGYQAEGNGTESAPESK